jgi:mRNA interferase MazF
MREGDIILTSMLQADGKVKNRPAIYLREMPPFRDTLVWSQHPDSLARARF